MIHTLKINSVAYHRNGVSGNGFHVVLFDEKRGGKWEHKVAVVFPEHNDNDGYIAVLDVDMLAAGNITFGENSWRGDTYRAEMDKAIGNWQVSDYGNSMKESA